MCFVELKQWSIRPHSCTCHLCKWCNPRGWRVGPKLAHARKCNSEIRYLGGLKGASDPQIWLVYTAIHSARDIEWLWMINNHLVWHQVHTSYWILFRILLDPFWWVRCPWPCQYVQDISSFLYNQSQSWSNKKASMNNRQWTLPSKWQNCQCSPATKCTQK